MCAAGEPVDADIAESPESQPGLIGLMPIPADVAVHGFGAAVVFRIEIAVFVQNFRKGEIQNLTGGGIQRALHIAGDFLAEINDGLALRRHDETCAGHPFLLCNLFSLLGNQGFKGSVKAYGLLVQGRGNRCIIDFAIIYFGKADRSFGYLPAFVGDYGFLVPILVCNDYLGQQACRSGAQFLLVGRTIITHQMGAVPAFADGDSNPVFLIQKICNVIFLILEPFAIGSPAGGKDKVAHSFAV